MHGTIDENLPDTVLQDEDTQNGQNLLGSQIVHNNYVYFGHATTTSHLGLYLRQLLYALMHIYSTSVHTNACNKQSDVCYLSYFHVHTAINILRFFGYPREHNFGLVLILSPTGCTEGCVYFPQSCRNTHLPHFLDCLLNTTLIPYLFSFSRYFTNESAINTAEYKVREQAYCAWAI